jgi:hypothetical protein
MPPLAGCRSLQILARSPAQQTVLVQLAAPIGYSAIVEQSLVGPKGGQALVERTVAAISEIWTP